LEDDPFQPTIFLTSLLSIVRENWFDDISTLIILGLLLIVLIFLSGLFSSSENAFFSLGPNNLVELNDDNSVSSQTVLHLINHPDKHQASRNLLGTILLLNNFVNITLVILSSLFINTLLALESFPIIAFLLQVVLITFILVLLGEIIPKIYSTQNNVKIAKFMAIPLLWLQRLTFPLVWLLTRSTVIFDRFVDKTTYKVSVEELNHAIEIAGSENTTDEKSILKGLVNYGNISVKQIMRPRMDITAVELDAPFDELIKKIEDWGYSRLPVYEDTFDNIKGVLYIKDLVPLLSEQNEYDWVDLIRNPFFVPEFKKIDDLLNEFQEKRIHMAIVVDEYGGTSGLVTMEDILEEIFGEIKDEFDDEEINYSQLDENTYLLEGKISLNDVCKIFDVESSYFDDVKGEVDTLGGFIMELAQKIPQRGHTLVFNQFTFIVEAADKRRLKRVKAVFKPEEETDENID
jgi:putative hemolysin